MNAQDRRLPSTGAKRFGHKSTKSAGRMTRALDKGGYFDYRIDRERKFLMHGTKKPAPRTPMMGKMDGKKQPKKNNKKGY